VLLGRDVPEGRAGPAEMNVTAARTFYLLFIFLIACLSDLFRLPTRGKVQLMTYPDFAEVLQARISADLQAEKIACTSRKDVDEGCSLDRGTVDIAALEESVVQAEVHAEQPRQEVERAAKKIAELECQITTLQEAIAKGEALREQQVQEVQHSAKRADHLVAELIEMTGEFVEMSKQIREQTAAIDKQRAELDDYKRGS
jgi:chromosome segregation ATPase